jgi:hypothetical protein
MIRQLNQIQLLSYSRGPVVRRNQLRLFHVCSCPESLSQLENTIRKVRTNTLANLRARESARKEFGSHFLATDEEDFEGES